MSHLWSCKKGDKIEVYHQEAVIIKIEAFHVVVEYLNGEQKTIDINTQIRKL